MSKEQIVKSTDWLTRGIPKEELEREKQEAIMSADLELCHTEFVSGVGEIYTDYDTTAQKMFAKGYRKQSEGEWKIMRMGDGERIRTCSSCLISQSVNVYKGKVMFRYCPYCGAKMKGD